MIQLRTILLLFALGLPMIAGCGGEEEPAVPDPAAAETAAVEAPPAPPPAWPNPEPPLAYRVQAVNDGGSVAGVARVAVEGRGITYADLGDQPCPGELTAETPVYPPGPLMNAVVWLEGIEAGEALPQAGVQLTVRGCQLEPRVQLAPLGTELAATAVGESARQLRLIRFAGYQDLGSIELTADHPEGTHRLRQVGPVHLRDETYPGARGWLWVMEHPYHAVTDAAGAFHFANVPPSPKDGHYTLHIWHEAYPAETRELKVPAGGQTTVELTLGPELES